VSSRIVACVPSVDSDDTEKSITVLAHGIPFRSLRRIAWSEDFTVVQECRLGISGRSLPIDPIWPGFAINTVFYAVILWLIFAAPLALRRRRRTKRGLCPKCAYDLRGTPQATACPECGASERLSRR